MAFLTTIRIRREDRHKIVESSIFDELMQLYKASNDYVSGVRLVKLDNDPIGTDQRHFEGAFASTVDENRFRIIRTVHDDKDRLPKNSYGIDIVKSDNDVFMEEVGLISGALWVGSIITPHHSSTIQPFLQQSGSLV